MRPILLAAALVAFCVPAAARDRHHDLLEMSQRLNRDTGPCYRVTVSRDGPGRARWSTRCLASQAVQDAAKIRDPRLRRRLLAELAAVMQARGDETAAAQILDQASGISVSESVSSGSDYRAARSYGDPVMRTQAMISLIGGVPGDALPLNSAPAPSFDDRPRPRSNWRERSPPVGKAAITPNFNAYCMVQRGDNARAEFAAGGWRCKVGISATDIDFDDLCRWQLGGDAVAAMTKIGDPRFVACFAGN